MISMSAKDSQGKHGSNPLKGQIDCCALQVSEPEKSERKEMTARQSLLIDQGQTCPGKKVLKIV